MSDSTPPALGLGLSMSHAQEQFPKAFVLVGGAETGRRSVSGLSSKGRQRTLNQLLSSPSSKCGHNPV